MVAVEDIPYKLLEARILSYIASNPHSSTKLENLEDRIFHYCKFKYRGRNREAMLERIWNCVDDMFKQGMLIQHFSKKMTMVKINSEIQE